MVVMVLPIREFLAFKMSVFEFANHVFIFCVLILKYPESQSMDFVSNISNLSVSCGKASVSKLACDEIKIKSVL